MTFPTGREIRRFLMAFLPLMVVLAWPFAFIGRPYQALERGVVNSVILNSTTTPIVARLVKDPRPDHDWITVAAVWDQANKLFRDRIEIDIHQLFYLPTAVFLALVLAEKWRFGGRRTALKLVLGILSFQVRGWVPFMALEQSITGANHSGASHLVLALVNKSLVAPLGMAYAMPLFWWLGLSRMFRKKEA